MNDRESEKVTDQGAARARDALSRIWRWALLVATACTPPPPAPTPAPLPPPAPAPIPIPVAPPVTIMPAEGRVDIGAGGSLWYRISGSAPDTVLVPLGVYLREALAALGSSHTLVFYDPRSRGRSDSVADSTQATFANDVSDLEAVRSRLGISRFSVIGFSYFGAVVAAYAAEHGERVARVVLLSPIEPSDSLERSFDPPERRTRLDTTRARTLVKSRAAGRDTADATGYCSAYWLLNAPLFVGDTARAGRVNAPWCQFPNETPRAMGTQMARVMRSLGSSRDFTPLAARIRAPVLVIYGDQDLVVNPAGARSWAQVISGARAWPVRGAGHFAFLEEPDAVVRAIDRFLKGEWP